MKPLYIGLLILASIAFCMGHPDPPIVKNNDKGNTDPRICKNKKTDENSSDGNENDNDSKENNGNRDDGNQDDSNGDCCKENTAPSPSIFDLNRAIAYCGSNYIQQTCDCDINYVYVTECLCHKMREKMPDFPNKGCLSMEDIGCEFDKYFDSDYERKCTPKEEADNEEEETDEECEEDDE